MIVKGCSTPAIVRMNVSAPACVAGRRRTSLDGGNRGVPRCG
nr:MAG TPA: hypothetical protein [Caudoviricetes sp.]